MYYIGQGLQSLPTVSSLRTAMLPLAACSLMRLQRSLAGSLTMLLKTDYLYRSCLSCELSAELITQSKSQSKRLSGATAVHKQFWAAFSMFELV
jgi:hypothetical protein